MTQTATVTALPAVPGGPVELTVTRQAACGHGCTGCGRCGGRNAGMVIHAGCGVPVAVGDRVEVASDGGRVLGAAALVYGLPVVLFLLGYVLTGALPEIWRYACGGAGFLLGLAAAVLWDRRMGRKAAMSYRVTRKL